MFSASFREAFDRTATHPSTAAAATGPSVNSSQPAKDTAEPNRSGVESAPSLAARLSTPPLLTPSVVEQLGLDYDLPPLKVDSRSGQEILAEIIDRLSDQKDFDVYSQQFLSVYSRLSMDPEDQPHHHQLSESLKHDSHGGLIEGDKLADPTIMDPVGLLHQPTAAERQTEEKFHEELMKQFDQVGLEHRSGGAVEPIAEKHSPVENVSPPSSDSNDFVQLEKPTDLLDFSPLKASADRGEMFKPTLSEEAVITPSDDVAVPYGEDLRDFSSSAAGLREKSPAETFGDFMAEAKAEAGVTYKNLTDEINKHLNLEPDLPEEEEEEEFFHKASPAPAFEKTPSPEPIVEKKHEVQHVELPPTQEPLQPTAPPAKTMEPFVMPTEAFSAIEEFLGGGTGSPVIEAKEEFVEPPPPEPKKEPTPPPPAPVQPVFEAPKEPIVTAPPTPKAATPPPPAVVKAEKPAEPAKKKESDARGCCFLHGLQALDPRIIDLIYWRDPRKSGVVFGGTLALLLALATFSFISVFAYFGLAILTVTVNYRIYKYVANHLQKSEDGNPFKEYLEKDIAVPQEKVHEQVDIFVQHLQDLIRQLRRLFLVESIADSLKFGVLLWALTYVGHWFSGIALVIIAFVALFSIPKLYEVYQEPIDRYYNLAHTHVQSVTDKVQEKLPFLKKKQQ